MRRIVAGSSRCEGGRGVKGIQGRREVMSPRWLEVGPGILRDGIHNSGKMLQTKSSVYVQMDGEKRIKVKRKMIEGSV